MAPSHEPAVTEIRCEEIEQMFEMVEEDELQQLANTFRYGSSDGRVCRKYGKDTHRKQIEISIRRNSE